VNLPNPLSPDRSVDVSDADARVARVLVPVDFSACTLEVLQQAKMFAKQFAATVDVLHVVPWNAAGEKAGAGDSRLIHPSVEVVRQGLQRLVAILWESELKATVSVRVREGRAHEVILREACSTNASLIIMGTRDRSWLSGLVRRNTMKRVVQNSPCPVMVLRVGLTGRKESCCNPTANLNILMLNLALDSIK
jgi:nucleotide-binding universal stress UspA family protein